jgi:hypothetical protein
MSAGRNPAEVPVYRPFALLALAATVGGGTPLGIWLLAWRYLGAPAVPIEWLLLHAHLQTFGFFGILIPGVAPHLLARFTGRPLGREPATRWVLGLLAAGLGLRVVGTWSGSTAMPLAAALLQAGGLLVLAAWVWRALDPVPLRLLRWQLTAASGWLAAACALEAALRLAALATGALLPEAAGMRAVHGIALFGGVLGWILGVLLRAGPMFVAGWEPPRPIASLIPWALWAGAGLIAATAWGGGREAPVLARLGETLALGGACALFLAGGVWRAAPRALPMLGRSAVEARIFRMAALSAGAARIGAAAATALTAAGLDASVVADAVRHLVTVGFMTSVVTAMAFRLVPVLEGVALPWPGLRHVAFWALTAGTALRTGQVAVGLGWVALAPLVALSGALVWVALGCLAATVLGAMARGAGAAAERAAGGSRRIP